MGVAVSNYLTPEENPADFKAPQSSAMHIQQLVCLLLLILKLCLIGTHRLVHFKCYQTPLLTLSSMCLAHKQCSAFTGVVCIYMCTSINVSVSPDP